MPQKSDLLQGTLDLLILKVVALGPVHGYGISQRIRQISEQVLHVQHDCLLRFGRSDDLATGSTTVVSIAPRAEYCRGGEDHESSTAKHVTTSSSTS